MDETNLIVNSKRHLLDGATGTELNRRGVDTGLPLWSARALINERDAAILQNIHEDYLRAGAHIISTNTFRTNRRALAPSGNADRALELTRRAVAWIEDTAKTKKPFFLYFPLTSPHYPVVPAPEFVGKSGAGKYGDFVHQTDWSVGQVLDALQRSGTADNTLIIFTSDNGAEVTGEVKPGVYDRAQEFDHRSSGDLRGAKRDAWEGGHRVPFITRWPGKIPAGTENDYTMCHVDFIATVAAILEAKLPENAAEDSVNVLPVLLGEKLTSPIRDATIHHSAQGKFAIRQGDWVLIDAPTGDDNNAHGEPHWLKAERSYIPHDQPGELFNLSEDPSQRVNHFADQPQLVSRMKVLLEKYKTEGRSTPGAPQQNDVEIQPYGSRKSHSTH
jgi:arylsulfatase A-like enzyme